MDTCKQGSTAWTCMHHHVMFYTNTKISLIYKNTSSVQSCREKMFVRATSHLHCTTKMSLRMSVEHGMHAHASQCCRRLFTDVHACDAMNKTSVDLIWLASVSQHVTSMHKEGPYPPRLRRLLTVPPWCAHSALVSPLGIQRDRR